MSIAISTVIQPSIILRGCAIAFSLFLLSIGVYIGSLDLPILNQLTLIALCVLAALWSLLYCRRVSQTKLAVSIDGQGRLRCHPTNTAVSDTKPYRLISGTTLWSRALFLRLRNEDKQTNLVILPDSLSKDNFRRLSIACKWIVTHSSADTN